MPRPGVDVTLSTSVGSVSLPTDTGVSFVTHFTDRGPIGPVLVQSLAQFVQVFGGRQTYSPLYDWLDVYFREGGNSAWVSRVVGPNPTTGTRNLMDAQGSPQVSLVATALGPGAWSAGYSLAVVAGTVGGTYQINVLDANSNVLENSGNLLDQASAVAWSQGSNYVRLALGVSTQNPAVAAASALSAGTDDRVNATDTQWANAQEMFTFDLGPGQVCQPGRTTSTAYSQLSLHAADKNRVAILDLVDTATDTTLEAAAAGVNNQRCAAYAPWVVVPGFTPGATRTVPPSALVCGLIARNDASLGPDRPSAGNAGVSRYAIGVSQLAWNSVIRGNLNGAGVNVIRNWPLNGGVRVYGWRSTVNAGSTPNWIDFGNSRLYMAIAAKLDVIGENYVFDDIDGQNGSTINSFHDALAGELLTWYTSGQLFGDSSEEAFVVDTGPSVNTLQTIANNELHANVYVRMSPMAEWTQISINKIAVTDSVPGV